MGQMISSSFSSQSDFSPSLFANGRAGKSDSFSERERSKFFSSEEVKETFALAQAEQFAHVPYQFHQTVNKGHGRLEIRRYWTIADPEYLAYLDPKKRWKGVRSIGMVQAERWMARGDHAGDPLLSAELLLCQDVCSCGTRPLGD